MATFKAIALDMMGVVYPIGDDLRELVIPFLRREGCALPEQDLIGAYRRGYRGEPPAHFWQALGFDPPFTDIETRLMKLYELAPGAREFLEKLHQAEIPLFSLSNDLAGWASLRRTTLGIDGYFAASVISGEVGVAKPEPGIYQALEELLPCPTTECLFVDDRVVNLDGAATSGFATALFGVDSAETHVPIPDFKALQSYLAL